MSLFRRLVKFFVPTFYGGKGGGGGTNTSSTVQIQKIPQDLLPYYTLAMKLFEKQNYATKDDPGPAPVNFSNVHKQLTDPSSSYYGINDANVGKAQGIAMFNANQAVKQAQYDKNQQKLAVLNNAMFHNSSVPAGLPGSKASAPSHAVPNGTSAHPQISTTSTPTPTVENGGIYGVPAVVAPATPATSIPDMPVIYDNRTTHRSTGGSVTGTSTDTTSDVTGAKSDTNVVHARTGGIASLAGVRHYDTGGTVAATTSGGTGASTVAGSSGADVTGTKYLPSNPMTTDANNNYLLGSSTAAQTGLQQLANTSAKELSAPDNSLAAGMIDTASNKAAQAITSAGTAGTNATAAGSASQTAGNAANTLANSNATIIGNAALNAGASSQVLGQGAQGIANTGGSQYGGLGSAYGAVSNQLGVDASSLSSPSLTYGKEGANLGLAGVGYGNVGLANATQGAQAGQQYANSATDSGTVSQYMNPYLKQSLDPQLKLMQQQEDIEKAKNNSQAAQSSAYGGSRNAVMNALTQQGYDLTQANLIGQGYNNAYDKAQQNIQNASNIGLQGLNAANQGLNTAISGSQAGMQGAQIGLQGVGAANSAYQTGIQGQQTGIAGAQAGLAGVNTALAGSGLNLQGQNQAISAANTATNAGQYGLQGTQLAQAGDTAAINAASTANSAAQNQLTGAVDTAGMATTLGNLNAQDLANKQAVINIQTGLGANEQATYQASLSAELDAFNNQINQPNNVNSTLLSLLGGVNTSSTNNTSKSAAPSISTPYTGMATTVAGYALANKKTGGLLKNKKMKTGGIADAAIYKMLNGGK